MSRLVARLTALLLLGLASLAPATAHAQRRDGEMPALLLVELRTPARFGEVDVPAGRYRVSLVEGRVTLVSEATMVVALSAEVTVVEEAAGGAAVVLRESGDALELVVTGPAGSATVRGRKAGAISPASPIEYTAKTEDEAVGAPQSRRISDEAAVSDALEHLTASVDHCGDGAHRGQWTTDEPRFVRCVCPIVNRWRLPRVSSPLRVHRSFTRERAGWSITVRTDGRVQDCRVWRGATSPEVTAIVAPAAKPATPPAPVAPPSSSAPAPAAAAAEPGAAAAAPAAPAPPIAPAPTP